ncbi:hypothetical protein Golax_019687, partial [Gossypium laxum]|nr:hypothetical protein [Gossypium laxum]
MEDNIAGLSLRDDDDEAWPMAPEGSDVRSGFEFCLVSCFLTTSVIHFEAMRTTMANLWHPIWGITISDLCEKWFLFYFYTEIDIEQALQDSPWTFNNHLLVFHRLLLGEDPLQERGLNLGKGSSFHGTHLSTVSTSTFVKEVSNTLGLTLDKSRSEGISTGSKDANDRCVVMVEFTQQHSSSMFGLDGKKQARFFFTVSIIAIDLDSKQTPLTFDVAELADHYDSNQLEHLWFRESMKRSSFATYAAFSCRVIWVPILMWLLLMMLLGRVEDLRGFMGLWWNRTELTPSMEAFCSVLDNCELHDLSFERLWFIWERDVASLSEVVSRQLDTMFHFESRWVFKSSCEYEIIRADPFDDILAEITKVKLTLNMEADREDLFWCQRAWVNWLRYGDRSTSFYHKFTTFRKHLNSVSSLVDDDGRTCLDIDAMFGVATRYFQGFFTSSRSEDFDNFLEGIKIISTVLVNRFKKVLSVSINEARSAFVPGCFI